MATNTVELYLDSMTAYAPGLINIGKLDYDRFKSVK